MCNKFRKEGTFNKTTENSQLISISISISSIFSGLSFEYEKNGMLAYWKLYLIESTNMINNSVDLGNNLMITKVMIICICAPQLDRLDYNVNKGKD